DRFVPTIERSIIDQVVPARDVGVGVHGENLLGNRLDYGAGVFNGEINGDYDVEKRKDLAARVAVRPFNGEDPLPLLRRLQLGAAVTTGIQKAPVTPATLRTPATVPWLVFNTGVRADGLRNRYSPELAYFYGPFGLVAQYFYQTQKLRPVALGTAGSNYLV